MGLFADKESAPKIFTTISGPELSDIIREMGFAPELTTDKGGDPLIRFRVEGMMCQIFFYGCENSRSDSLQFSAGFATGPGASNLHFDDLVAQGRVGSFLNVTGAEATNHYQHIAVEKTRLHIPILFGQDVIHGHRTTFPIPLAIAASFDPSAAELVAHYGATEARIDGVPWVFSPIVITG